MSRFGSNLLQVRRRLQEYNEVSLLESMVKQSDALKFGCFRLGIHAQNFCNVA